MSNLPISVRPVQGPYSVSDGTSGDQGVITTALFHQTGNSSLSSLADGMSGTLPLYPPSTSFGSGLTVSSNNIVFSATGKVQIDFTVQGFIDSNADNVSVGIDIDCMKNAAAIDDLRFILGPTIGSHHGGVFKVKESNQIIVDVVPGDVLWWRIEKSGEVNPGNLITQIYEVRNWTVRFLEQAS